MFKMRFSDTWVKKVMNCICSTSFEVLINGQKGSQFGASTGLRQGCPLSSYLFIICLKGLLALIRTEADRGSIQGIQVARDAPPITHIFFTDDSLLFAKADLNSVISLKNMRLHRDKR